MSTQRPPEGARSHAPIHRLTNEDEWAAVRAGRRIALLTRVVGMVGTPMERTLHFTFEGETGRSSRARCSFVDPAHVPPFDGDKAWFEMEKVKAKPWPYWRAVRQVEPPADA